MHPGAVRVLPEGRPEGNTLPRGNAGRHRDAVRAELRRPGRIPVQTAIYNLETPKGKIGTPAEFGFLYNEQQAIRFDAHVKKINGKYQVTVLSANTNEGENINGVSITLWGTPADPSHTPWRFKEHPAEAGKSQTGEESNESPVRPFLTNPSDCLASAEEAPTTKLFYDSWENPVPTEENGEPKLTRARHRRSRRARGHRLRKPVVQAGSAVPPAACRRRRLAEGGRAVRLRIRTEASPARRKRRTHDAAAEGHEGHASGRRRAFTECGQRP